MMLPPPVPEMVCSCTLPKREYVVYEARGSGKAIHAVAFLQSLW